MKARLVGTNAPRGQLGRWAVQVRAVSLEHSEGWPNPTVMTTSSFWQGFTVNGPPFDAYRAGVVVPTLKLVDDVADLQQPRLNQACAARHPTLPPTCSAVLRYGAKYQVYRASGSRAIRQSRSDVSGRPRANGRRSAEQPPAPLRGGALKRSTCPLRAVMLCWQANSVVVANRPLRHVEHDIITKAPLVAQPPLGRHPRAPSSASCDNSIEDDCRLLDI